MSTVNEKSSDLAVFLQAVASLETQIEKKRLALNLLQFYSSEVAFNILTEFSTGKLISQADLAAFLKDWQVETTNTEIRGIFLEFCPIRSVMDYASFLLLTMPEAYLDKKDARISLESLSEELRFKLESALVLFLMKELKFQKEIETRRLHLLSSKKVGILELFRLIDVQRKGFVNYQDVAGFLESFDLKFDANSWASLLFRAKKKRCVNVHKEKISFTDFHDLVYPVTFFEKLIQREMDDCIVYLDEKEQGNTSKKVPAIAENPNALYETPQKNIQKEKYGSHEGTGKDTLSKFTTKPQTSKKPSNQPTATKSEKKSPLKQRTSFLSPFHNVSDDERGMMYLTSKSDLFESDNSVHDIYLGQDWGQFKGQRILMSQANSKPAEPDILSIEVTDEEGDKPSLIPFNKDYSKEVGGKCLPSKYVRYFLSLKEAADIMYA